MWLFFPVPFEPLKLIVLYFVRPLQIPYLVRSIFLPWWFHAEGALCSASVWYSTVVTEHELCVLHRPLRGSTRREKSSGSQDCRTAAVAVPGRKDLSVGYFMRSGFRHFRLQ